MRVFGIVVAVIFTLILLPLGCSALGVWGSVSTAPGRVIGKTLETDNIIFNYEYFFDTNAAYKSRLSQVQEYRQLLASETDAGEKIRLRTEYSAMQQSCRELATKYNANSRKLNRGLFKDRQLPYELDETSCN